MSAVTDSTYAGREGWTPFVSKQRELELKRAYGLKESDQVNFYVVPPNNKVKAGSLIWTPMSGKAKRLQQDVYILKGKIAAAEYSDLPPKERAKKVQYLRCQLKYTSSCLSGEMASLPKAGYVVVEE